MIDRVNGSTITPDQWISFEKDGTCNINIGFDEVVHWKAYTHLILFYRDWNSTTDFAFIPYYYANGILTMKGEGEFNLELHNVQ